MQGDKNIFAPKNFGEFAMPCFKHISIKMQKYFMIRYSVVQLK